MHKCPVQSLYNLIGQRQDISGEIRDPRTFWYFGTPKLAPWTLKIYELKIYEHLRNEQIRSILVQIKTDTITIIRGIRVRGA